MFLYEKDMKKAFWDKYKTRDGIISYAFETGRRNGMDLVTFESFGSEFEFNAFEFKLHNLKKAILQAKYNLKFVHKSWIVLPEEKSDLMKNKYYANIKGITGIGVITVKENGFYDFLIKTYKQDDDKIVLNQDLLNLISRR